MGKIDTVIFNYRVDDIFEELTKRTSKLGQMRGTEQEPFLVDRLSLTKGENFMFSEFLEDAVSETYDWLRAFGRCIPMYDKIVLKYEDRKEYINHKCTIQANGRLLDGNVYKEDNCTFRVSGTQIQLSHKTITVSNLTDSNKTVKIICNATLYENVKGEIVTHVITTETIEEISTHVQHEVHIEYLPDVVTPSYINRVDVEIKVEILPTVVEPIKKGTYVEYYTDYSNPDFYELYQVNYDCTNADWLDYSCKLAVDPRDCVVFILERPIHMDLNVMSSIDRNIKEALVNYIIFKWFEYTNVEEADKFFAKFEYYAEKAKIGMDSETKIRQRKYNINH